MFCIRTMLLFILTPLTLKPWRTGGFNFAFADIWAPHCQRKDVFLSTTSVTSASFREVNHMHCRCLGYSERLLLSDKTGKQEAKSLTVSPLA